MERYLQRKLSKNNTMKKLLLLILSISLYSATFAQYESVLSDTSRYWKVYNYRAFFGVDVFADSMYLGKDSVINNITYRELQSNNYNTRVFGPKPYGFLREDTTLGKLWYLSNTNFSQSAEICVYDLNLAVNDTFVVSTDSLVVERVYFQNNRKHIKLKLFSQNQYQLSYPGFSQSFVYDTLLFIEGVGSTRGFDNRVNTINFYGRQSSGRLLCAFQQNNQIFQHQLKPAVPFLDDCDTFNLAVSLHEVQTTENPLSIHPNPTSGLVNINSSIKLESTELFTVSGSRIESSTFNQNLRDDNSFLLPEAPGIYLLRVITKEGSVHLEKVVKQ
jgi:hypothetical protein